MQIEGKTLQQYFCIDCINNYGWANVMLWHMDGKYMLTTIVSYGD